MPTFGDAAHMLAVPNASVSCTHEMEITVSCRFTVAEWLTHSPATLEVMVSRPSLDDISEIYFIESIQSSALRHLKWSV